MRVLTAEEIMRALKRKPVGYVDGEMPDFTSASKEERLEPSEMPTGQGEL